MSKIALSSNPLGSGTFTVASPNSNTNRTLTLPDVTATLITDSAGGLNIGNGQLVKDASGKVGIGTTSLSEKLNISTDSSITDPFSFVDTRVGFERSWVIGPGVGGVGAFVFRDRSASQNRFQIQSDGELQSWCVNAVRPQYACRAWVNFNGTGTVAIRASGNVSSITDNGRGDYTVNMVTSMPDSNYSVVAMGRSNTSAYGQSWSTNVSQLTTPTVSAFRLVNSFQDDNSNSVTYEDSDYMFAQVVR